MANNVYGDLNDYIDYIARRFPGEYGQSIQGLLSNPPPSSPGGQQVAPGAVAPQMPPPINIPPGPPPAAPSAEPEPIASGTTAPAPGASGQGGGDGMFKLAQQLMGQAGKTQGLPFPDLAKIQPGNTDPMRPLPLTLPKFGGGPYG